MVSEQVQGTSTSQSYGSIPAAQIPPALWRLVQSGRVYSLAFPIGSRTPQGSTAFPFTMRLGVPHDEGTMGEGPFAEATMHISMSDHAGTHIDALCHYSEQIDGARILYGDVPVSAVEGPVGFATLGIDECPPIITRGVLLDVARFQGVAVLPDSYGISEAELEACARSQGIEILAGDCVLIRTGFSMYRDSEPERFSTLGAGLTPEACAWLGDQRIAMAGADTMSFERVPSPHIGHLELTRRRGIPVINQVDCEGLAADRVYSFLFMALPLKLVGATASPVSPIAIV